MNDIADKLSIIVGQLAGMWALLGCWFFWWAVRNK